MVRLTGGRWRGRAIHVLPGLTTRPTGSKVRGAVFDMLQREVVGARFVDLCSGAGTMGIEALSRGAGHAVFVEKNRRAIALLRRNLERLDLPESAATLCPFSAGRWAESPGPGGDILFCDPPYRSRLLGQLLPRLAERGRVNPGGHLVAEASRAVDLSSLQLPGLSLVRVRRHGDTVLWLWRREQGE